MGTSGLSHKTGMLSGCLRPKRRSSSGLGRTQENAAKSGTGPQEQLVEMILIVRGMIVGYSLASDGCHPRTRGTLLNDLE